MLLLWTNSPKGSSYPRMRSKPSWSRQDWACEEAAYLPFIQSWDDDGLLLSCYIFTLISLSVNSWLLAKIPSHGKKRLGFLTFLHGRKVFQICHFLCRLWALRSSATQSLMGSADTALTLSWSSWVWRTSLASKCRVFEDPWMPSWLSSTAVSSTTCVLSSSFLGRRKDSHGWRDSNTGQPRCQGNNSIVKQLT